MIYKYLMLFFSICSVHVLSAQDYVWVKQSGGAGEEDARSVTLDQYGNIYTTGQFKTTADFDPGPDTFNLTSAGGFDVFVTKFNADGDFMWARRFGGSSEDYGYSVVVDANGNVIVGGFFAGTADFDPGSNTYNLTSAGNDDAFICKLNTSGNFVWAERFGGALNDYIRTLAVDLNGNILSSGSFQSTVDFDPDSSVTTLFTSAGEGDIFVRKLNASGQLLWVKQLGGIANDQTYCIRTDLAGYVYLSGYFYGTSDFNPGPDTISLTSAGSGDVFVCKLNPSGDLVWAKSFGGITFDQSYGLAVDHNGNVFTTGYFTGAADFDPGNGNYTLSSVNSSSDVFISKLDANGNFQWAGQMGGDQSDVSRAAAVDRKGNVYITGSFRTTADLDPTSSVYNFTSFGSSDIFITKVNGAGSFVWTKQLGGSTGDGAQAIIIDPAGNIFTTGAFTGTADFDPGNGNSANVSAGNSDNYLSKLSTCNTEHTEQVTSCGSYVWQSKTLIHSGIYTDTIPNQAGCDSIMRLLLTVVTIDKTISAAGSVLTSNAPPGTNTYQWVDCNLNYAPIPGATNQTYQALNTGSYAVIVTRNGCSDTSTCYLVNTTGSAEKQVVSSVYPNPVQQGITIRLNRPCQNIRVLVTDVAGREIARHYFSSSQHLNFDLNGSKGVYFIEVTAAEERTAHLRVVKQ